MFEPVEIDKMVYFHFRSKDTLVFKKIWTDGFSNILTHFLTYDINGNYLGELDLDTVVSSYKDCSLTDGWTNLLVLKKYQSTNTIFYFYDRCFNKIR